MQMEAIKAKVAATYKVKKSWLEKKLKDAEKNPRLSPMLAKAELVRRSVSERLQRFYS